jgi:hypothetical protein
MSISGRPVARTDRSWPISSCIKVELSHGDVGATSEMNVRIKGIVIAADIRTDVIDVDRATRYISQHLSKAMTATLAAAPFVSAVTRTLWYSYILQCSLNC